ncbi:MAG: DUF1501 domain-containing protein [Xanthomonadales bacterium]|nr:DUF1501 domain-containing protein [Xanthomonadales bacterium]
MKQFSRRKFLKGSGLVTLAGLGGMQLGFGGLNAYAATNTKDLLVYVFLNGGMDGLHMVPPRSGPDYTEYSTVLRPNLHINNSESLPLNGSSLFGLHPSATAMANLFNQNKMAIIHATGLSEPNRSHFVATALMELGLQGQISSIGTGWLSRYFSSSLNSPADALIPTLVPSYNSPDAVLGDPAALVMGSPNQFSLDRGFWGWGDEMQMVLGELNQNPDTLEKVASNQALSASAIVQGIDWDGYVPGNSAVYPGGSFGDQLRTTAQLYKENVGLGVAYIPYGGWDTHTNQGTGTTGIFANLTLGLSEGLNALYQDLSATHGNSFTIIVQSEFGRRAYQNGANSTDHGYGNPMFVIGDSVNGGFHGQFPGLLPNQLLVGQDLNATVDYRDVVSEVLLKRLHNRFLGHIFSGYTNYTELGVIAGTGLSPVFDFDYNTLFKSGFE